MVKDTDRSTVWSDGPRNKYDPGSMNGPVNKRMEVKRQKSTAIGESIPTLNLMGKGPGSKFFFQSTDLSL